MMTATNKPRMSEDDLLAGVLDLCRLLGLRTAHFRPARTERGWRTAVAGDGKGFPDLVIVGAYVLFVELKGDRGRLDDEQRAWRDAIGKAGGDWSLWTPADWLSGGVRRELYRLADKEMRTDA